MTTCTGSLQVGSMLAGVKEPSGTAAHQYACRRWTAMPRWRCCKTVCLLLDNCAARWAGPRKASLLAAFCWLVQQLGTHNNPLAGAPAQAYDVDYVEAPHGCCLLLLLLPPLLLLPCAPRPRPLPAHISGALRQASDVQPPRILDGGWIAGLHLAGLCLHPGLQVCQPVLQLLHVQGLFLQRCTQLSDIRG
jgi:hypothetical protein